MAKVTGIGGIFFKSNDPVKTKEWYAQHLGFETDQWGATFIFKLTENPEKNGYLQWTPFRHDTDYFGDTDQEYMINYRVDNLIELVEELKSSGITICDDIMTYDYGKFVHIIDGEGRKIELWEPIDEVFDELYNKMH